ncbi:MAG TPA: LamG domain-containing protein [Chloroflexi bacterium]|nr:LamG domain-containing protein [Chloroflexota bacterium]
MSKKDQRRRRVLLRLGSLIFPLFALFILISTFQATRASGEGYALEFDGTSDYVEFDPLTDTIGANWQYTKTVSVWVKPTTAAPIPTHALPESGALIVGDFPIWFGIYWANIDGVDKIWVFNITDATSPVRAAVGIPHNANEWIHIALVHENTTMSVYKNGSLVETVATGPTALGHFAPGGIELRVGGYIHTNRDGLFTGEIDEVRLYDTPLTPTEIRQDMFRPITSPPSNLKAYYAMSDGAGTTLTDDSGNGWNGTLIDGRVGSQKPPDGDTAAWITSTAFAGPRNALDFDGANDYVALGSNAQTLIGGSWANSKTIDLWLKPTSSGPAVANAAAGNLLAGGANWGISQANIGGQDSLWVWNNDGNEDRIGIPYTPLLWTHIALVHDGGTLTAYKNGELVGSVASGATSGDGSVYVGGRPGGQNFTGALDELRFWDYGRTQPEIQAQESLSQTLAYNQSGLTAYYRFDQYNDSDQTTLFDTTSGNHHGTLTNMDGNSDWVASGAFNIQDALLSVYLPLILK